MFVVRYCWALACLCLAGIGCARWTTNDDPELPSLPAPLMSNDTVVLEVAFVRLPAEPTEPSAELWTVVDEQALEADLRRRLADNGLRAGILGPQLPQLIRESLERQPDPLDVEDSGESSNGPASRRRMQLRAGKRAKVVATPIQSSWVSLMREDGVVRGKTLNEAQGVFSVKSIPLGDGRVRLELTPEIEYGPPRNRRVGRDGVWQFESSRDRRVYDNLRIECVLAPGQTLLLTSPPPAEGLGQQFFHHDGGAPLTYQVLLVRLAQTQRDDLFESFGENTPVATVSE